MIFDFFSEAGIKSKISAVGHASERRSSKKKNKRQVVDSSQSDSSGGYSVWTTTFMIITLAILLTAAVFATWKWVLPMLQNMNANNAEAPQE